MLSLRINSHILNIYLIFEDSLIKSLNYYLATRIDCFKNEIKRVMLLNLENFSLSRLRKSLFFKVCVVFMLCEIAILFTTIIQSQRYSTAQNKRIAVTIKENNQRLREALKNDIDYVSYQMKFIGKQIQKEGISNQKSIQKILSYAATDYKINISTSWNMFSWVDKKGYLTVDGEAGIIPAPKDLSQRDYIPLTIKEPWKLHLGKPVFGAVSKQWIIPAGMGITDENNKYVGSIVFGFEIKSLIAKMKKQLSDNYVKFIIFDKDYNFISTSSDQYEVQHSVISDELKSSKSASLYLNDKQIYSTVMADLPYVLVTIYDNEFLLQQIRSDFLFKFLAFSLFSLLLAGLLVLLMVYVIKPLKVFSIVTNDILEGKQDKENKLPSKVSSEMLDVLKGLVHIMAKVGKESQLYTEKAQQIISLKKASEEESKFAKELKKRQQRQFEVIMANLDIVKNARLQTTNIKHYQDNLDEIYRYNRNFAEYNTDIVDLQNINVKNLVENCLAIRRAETINKSITLNYDIANNIENYMGDKVSLMQIILSLLHYSISCTPKFGLIEANVAIESHIDQSAGCLLITIKDNGLGLSEQEREKLKIGNVKLYKVSNDPTSLSLPIIRHLIDLHKGTLSIDVKQGLGSIITLRLPYLSQKELLDDDSERSSDNVVYLSGKH